MLANLPRLYDPNLMVGYDTSDDACVYRISDTLALVQTVDFFPPMVDDPYRFGQIAAANALSDIYAMGAVPKTAMNLLCYPTCLTLDTVQAILAGGGDKVAEAGAVLAGGHTIQDPEPKYGLCVSGFVHPDRVLSNSGARPGDVVILTKALGTGVLSTAAKADLISMEEFTPALDSMATLNRAAADILPDFPVHACTDVTGFGLLGHVCEVARGSDVCITLSCKDLPLLPKAEELARMGIIPAGAYANMDYTRPYVCVEASAPRVLVDLAADPQTSGGLLIFVEERHALPLLDRLREIAPVSSIIGYVRPRTEHHLILT